MLPDNINAVYQQLQNAYAFFNQRFFDDDLPDCLFTLSPSYRSARGYATRSVCGYTENPVARDEIGLNLLCFGKRSEEEITSTLLHEMVHIWQFRYGDTIPMPGYHNKEWGEKMLKVGLIPSATGYPDGKMIGRTVSHYIHDSGPFPKAFQDLKARGYALSLVYQRPEKPKTESDQRTYRCDKCEVSARGKQGIHLICGICGKRMLMKPKRVREEEPDLSQLSLVAAEELLDGLGQ